MVSIFDKSYLYFSFYIFDPNLACYLNYSLFALKICFVIYNPGQNIRNKINSSKIGHDKKSLIPTSACFLTAIANDNFWKRDWALGYVSTLIWDFSNIS